MARFAMTVLLVALGLGIFANATAPATVAAGPAIGMVPAKAVPITLYGDGTSGSNGWGYGPTNISQPGPAITVDQGDVITFTLYSQDSPTAHNLVIDLNNDNAQGPSEPHSADFASATTPITYSYTANTAGTFQYICGIHGGGLMRGTFTVRGTTAPPSGDNTLLIVGGVVGVVIIVGAVAAVMMRRGKAKPPSQPPQP